MIADKTFVPRDVIGYWLSPFWLMVFVFKDITSYMYLKCQRHYLFNMEFCLVQICCSYTENKVYREMIAGMRKLEQQPSFIENCNIP